jgi:hypothetical protein
MIAGAVAAARPVMSFKRPDIVNSVSETPPATFDDFVASSVRFSPPTLRSAPSASSPMSSIERATFRASAAVRVPPRSRTRTSMMSSATR